MEITPVVLLAVLAGVCLAFPVLLLLINVDDDCLQQMPGFRAMDALSSRLNFIAVSSLWNASLLDIIFDPRLLLHLCSSLYNSRCSILRESIRIYISKFQQLSNSRVPTCTSFTFPACTSDSLPAHLHSTLLSTIQDVPS